MSAPNFSLQDAERYLLSLELFGMRFGLDRMRRLMTALGHPQNAFDSIHVVGTNGKSSTTRMIAAILARHGLRTGAYTSPHLASFTERIQVGERDLEAGAFAAAVGRAAHAARGSSTRLRIRTCRLPRWALFSDATSRWPAPPPRPISDRWTSGRWPTPRHTRVSRAGSRSSGATR